MYWNNPTVDAQTHKSRGQKFSNWVKDNSSRARGTGKERPRWVHPPDKLRELIIHLCSPRAKSATTNGSRTRIQGGVDGKGNSQKEKSVSLQLLVEGWCRLQYLRNNSSWETKKARERRREPVGGRERWRGLRARGRETERERRGET